MEKEYCVGVCSKSGIQYKYDIEDRDRIAKHHWWSQKNGVFAFINGKTVALSKYILGIDEKNTKVIKRNGDSFDFRKENLFYHNKFVCTEVGYEVECFDGRKFLIDKSKLEEVSKYVWHIDKNNYAITKTSSGRILKLHRLLLNVIDNPDVEVDHINRNTLDNRLTNLRIASRSLQNYNRDVSAYNKSGKVGVYKMTGYDKWCARIKENGHDHYLGSFDSFEQACQARSEAEQLYYPQ